MSIWHRRDDELAAVRSDVRHLREAVEHLVAAQRKEAESAKKLRAAFAAREGEWERGLADVVAANRAALERVVEKQQAVDGKWQRTFRELDGRMKSELKWRKIFSGQISALIRRLCLPLEAIPAPLNLTAQRFRVRSQNEEDGILLALLAEAGWGGRRFVEIGSGASGGNAAVLAQDCGWSGLMVDASDDAVAGARRRFARNPGVRVIEARVSPANVNGLLEQHGLAGDVDLLSIDIDSHDYWIFEALEVARPRLLMLEYNALFGPERRVTIPADHPMDGTPKGYGGASLAALDQLAQEKGYRLVGCEDAGVNAFFLRHDLAPRVQTVPPSVAFRPLQSRVDIDDRGVATDIFEVLRARALPLVEV